MHREIVELWNELKILLSDVSIVQKARSHNLNYITIFLLTSDILNSCHQYQENDNLTHEYVKRLLFTSYSSEMRLMFWGKCM